MKRFGAASSDSSDVWASGYQPPPQGVKLLKRKQIYSKEFQEMRDKLDTEESGGDEEEGGGFGGGGGVEKKRRLSIDQVKALERSFEKENKLEPERKNRLAEDLGLQPRQVAIWFQNRRARWKTKRLERDYGVLKSNYDSLRADYNCLEQENKSLLSQLTELKMKLQKQVQAAEDSLDHERRVIAEEEECPVSESAMAKPQFGYRSEFDASSNGDEEEEDPRLLKEEADAVMPMSSPTSVSSLNHNNTSTASTGSSCTTSVLSWLRGWDSRAEMTPMRAAAEEQQQGWLNFFSVDQAPTLHCYFATDDGK